MSTTMRDEIKSLRKELGLTQEQLAADLGVSFATVNRWENGHAQPSPLAMRALADLLVLAQNRRRDIIPSPQIEVAYGQTE